MPRTPYRSAAHGQALVRRPARSGPPDVDLAAEGFTLVGGRLDYIDARPVATLVYTRRAHVINLFIAPARGSDRGGKTEPQLQGFSIWRGASSGFAFSAVSEITASELKEFGARFEAELRSGEFAASHYPAERIVLWGESLGSGVAVAVAAEKTARAYPFMPVRWLMK